MRRFCSIVQSALGLMLSRVAGLSCFALYQCLVFPSFLTGALYYLVFLTDEALLKNACFVISYYIAQTLCTCNDINSLNIH